MLKPTASQKKAIETIDRNVAVNAGAGSGKTRVLVERYINILKNGDLKKDREIDSIVAITFTNKAAAEMKERVRQSLADRVNKDRKLKRLYNEIEKANISTIHSFCSKILRENPIESRLDPGFSLMDDYESKKLLKGVIESCITSGIDKEKEIFDFFRYFTIASLDAQDDIIGTIENLYRKVRSTGLKFSEVKDITLLNIDNVKEDIRIIEEIRDKFEYLITNLTKRTKLGKLVDNDIWIEFKNMKIDKIDESVISTIKYLASNIGTSKEEEDTIKSLKRDILQIYKIEEKDKRDIYEVLLDMIIEIDRKYSDEKKNRGVLDYEDLQIKVLNLLDNENIRKRYQEKFRYIMVDEFQDTNELQKKIIYKICSINSELDRQNLFIVGDPKQSIYGFRGADVEVFYDVMEEIEKVSQTETIILKDNFRTVNSVMEFINDIFGKLMGESYSELKPTKKSTTIDVEIIENNKLEIPKGENETDYTKRYEAEVIAKKIRELVNMKEENDKEKYKYKYKDVAILFRATTDNAIYEEALKKYGIPYHNLGGKGFYKRQEIVDIINALKAINNKYDTLSIVATLRSPMFGFSDEVLYWILKESKENIFEELNNDIPNIREDDKEKAKKAYKLLIRLNKMKSYVNVYDLISELIDKTYYIETWMLKFGNKQAMANIYKLLEMAREFSGIEDASLEEFINYIDTKVNENIDESQAQVESEESDSVNIMTIHKSKGLQFKVVVLPQMAKQFNLTYGNILFDKEVGIGIKHPDKLGKLDSGISPIYEKIREKQKYKDIEEYKRVLYVAMTRVEEILIVGNQSGKKKNKSFREMLKENMPKTNIFNKIENIDIDEEDFKLVTSIPKEAKEIRKFDNKIVPLLRNYDDFDSKYFNRFSITQYILFRECKRKFFMTYYKSLPVEDILADDEYQGQNEGEKYLIDPLVKGLIVHKICEIYEKGMDVEELVTNVVEMNNISPTKEIVKDINIYVDNYIKYYTDGYDKVFNEKQFYYKIMDRVLYGVIDRINIKDGVAEIIDFKTNKVTSKKMIINKYAPQIQLYAAAFKDIYNIEVKRAGLLMLKNGEFIEVPIDETSLIRNKREIEEFIKFVDVNKSIDDYEKNLKNCEYCRFKEICKI